MPSLIHRTLGKRAARSTVRGDNAWAQRPGMSYESLRCCGWNLTCLSVILAVASSTIRERRLVYFILKFLHTTPLYAKAVHFVAKPLPLAEILQWVDSGDKLGV